LSENGTNSISPTERGKRSKHLKVESLLALASPHKFFKFNPPPPLRFNVDIKIIDIKIIDIKIMDIKIMDIKIIDIKIIDIKIMDIKIIDTKIIDIKIINI
jgi:hypothetical protein